MKEIKLLQKGLFSRSFMDSRVKTRTVTSKERILGHLIGPLGMIMVINTMYALIELFFTEQVPIDKLYGTGTYLSMTIASRVIGTATGLAMGWVFQHTASRQGRFRPWGLIAGLLVALSGIPMFLVWGVPGKAYLTVIFTAYIIHNALGIVVYNAFANNIVALTTRNFSERTKIQFYRKLALTLISGILIGLVLTSVIYYQILINNRDAWAYLMIALCVCSIPLIFIEYYYTRERVMEDVASERGFAVLNISLGAQIKALLTNKYYLLMLIGTTIAGITGVMKGGNVTTNFCRWVLGATAENNIQMVYTILTGVPLGLGAIIAYPLARKMGVRNMSMLGFGMVGVGSVVGLLFPNNVIIAYIAGFIRQMGLIADCYVFPALLASVGDMVEHKSGFRPEGLLSASIIGLIFGLVSLPFGGAYETVLIASGFDAALTVQPTNVVDWVSFAFYGFDAALGLSWVVILYFMDIEKKLPGINAELNARRKAATLARGEEWIEPEEIERRETARREAEFEQNRIADLQALCARKGLDFDTENQKYVNRHMANSKKKRSHGL